MRLPSPLRRRRLRLRSPRDIRLSLTAMLSSLLVASSCAGSPSPAPPRTTAAAQASRAPNANDLYARDVFKELIEINTTESSGDTTRAAQAMAARLRAAGFPEADVRVLGEEARHGNLVARLRGRGTKRPILLLAHLDVVEAKKEDWSFDPFVFREQDGFFYGRGTSDDKDMAAIFVANMVRMKKEGFVPDRDIILALTAGEEGGGDFNGVRWLLAHHRDLIDSEFALNEGGGGEIKNGKYIANEFETSEKLYTSFDLQAKNDGGHSALPRRDNAIYQLAEALVRLSKFAFPVELNETTRAYLERLAVIEHNADMAAVARQNDAAAAARLSERPVYNSVLRTTCVATLLAAGHAENALPQSARATVNCRILPGTDPSRVEETLRGVIADPRIELRMHAHAPPSPPSPLSGDVVRAIESVTQSMWPGIPALPTMLSGATDGQQLRRAGIACYGLSGEFADIDDVRAHGKDERLPVRSFYEGREFLDRLVRKLTSGR